MDGPKSIAIDELSVSDERIQEAITIIVSSFLQKLSPVEVADSLHLSRSRFARLFREQVGRSPSRFVKDLRMQLTRCLLETTQLGIKEIFNRTGFSIRAIFCVISRRYMA
jgi:transcriptional regulator GlxA family with amidase domain